MANFKTVSFTQLLGKTLNAKQNEKALLAAVELVLDTSLEAARKNHEEWVTVAQRHKDEAKVAFGNAEDAFEDLKKGEGDAEELVQTLVSKKSRVDEIAETMQEDATKYARAFDGDDFRGDLHNVVVVAIKELKTVDEYKNCTKASELGKKVLKLTTATAAERMKIITADTVLASERERIVEYGKRLATMVDTAQKLASGEKLAKSEFVQKAAAIKQAIGNKDNQETLLGMFSQLALKIERADSTRQSGNLDAMKIQLATLSDEGEKRRKALSGKLRTTLVELQSLRTLYGKKFFAKLALPGLEKALTQVANDFKMLDARMLQAVRELDEAIKKVG